MLDPTAQREFALEVVRQLRAAGFEAYWAGGCVRDHLLGRTPKDYDVATAATPDEICRVFHNRKTLRIGATFGVIALIGPRAAGTFEITTFRRDAAYSDGRHPDSVSFASAREDAQRRDFTINGLFFDPVESRVIDFVDGQEDLHRQVVRAIGDPCQRFAEDKLRILRAVRMAARFGFDLDGATLAAMRAMADQIAVVSAERIAQEFRLLLVLPEKVRAAELLRESGLLRAVLPEVDTLTGALRAADNPQETWWDYTLRVRGELPTPSFPLAMAALLQAIGRSGPANETDASASADAAASIARNIARRWRLSNEEIERIEWLVRRQHALCDAASLPWPRVQRLLIAPHADELIALHEAQSAADRLPTDDLQFCRQRLAWPAEQLNPPPLVTGDDLIAKDIPPGPDYAVLLERVRDAQLEGTVTDKSEALAWLARMAAELANSRKNNP